MRKYGESKTTRIMMATVPHVTSGSELRKFQADGFLLDRVYSNTSDSPAYWRLVTQVTGFPDTYLFFHKNWMIAPSSARKLKWITILRLPTYLFPLEVTHFVNFGISLQYIYMSYSARPLLYTFKYVCSVKSYSFPSLSLSLSRV